MNMTGRNLINTKLSVLGLKTDPYERAGPIEHIMGSQNIKMYYKDYIDSVLACA